MIDGNNDIIFKKGDTSYNLADLSNVASGGGSVSLTNYSDASFGHVDISGNLLVKGNVNLYNEYYSVESGKLESVYFYGRGTQYTGLSSNNYHDLNQLTKGVVTSHSSCFNSSTGIFTAPRDGIYYFE